MELKLTQQYLQVVIVVCLKLVAVGVVADLLVDLFQLAARALSLSLLQAMTAHLIQAVRVIHTDLSVLL